MHDVLNAKQEKHHPLPMYFPMSNDYSSSCAQLETVSHSTELRFSKEAAKMKGKSNSLV